MNGDFTNYVTQINKENDIFAKAKLINSLVHEKNIRIVDVAKSLGKTSSYICHLLRLTHLPEIIVDGYYSKLISISHLFIISRIKDEQKLLEVYEQLLKHNYSVQQTEDTVREFLYEIKNKGERLQKTEVEKLVEEIKEHLNDAQIKVVQTRVKGKVIIEIKSNLETTSRVLKDILKKLGQS
jgi:hypothetical protein